MSFYKPRERSRKGSSVFLKIISGLPVKIQVLDDHPTLLYKHWIIDGAGRKVPIICPGFNLCPICQRNKAVGSRDDKRYIRTQRRYRVNALDLTPVVKCPSCGAEYHPKMLPDKCTVDTCGSSLDNIVPSPVMEVKILERGPQLMEQLASLESIPHPTTGKEESIQDFPVLLVASGEGREMTITVVHQPPMDIDISKFEKHDLLPSNYILTPEEIQHLISGGLMSDIKAARAATLSVEEETVDKEEIPF